MSPATGAAVIAEIETAFDGVSRGDGVTLHEADVIDDCGSDKERGAARQLDTETRWQDVPDELIERFSCPLSFLDGAGFAYYIPAYMRWAIRHYASSRSFSIDHTIYTLHSVGYSISPATLALPHLGETQRRAIASFLQFFCSDLAARHADSGHARAALDAFWGRYADPAIR